MSRGYYEIRGMRSEDTGVGTIVYGEHNYDDRYHDRYTRADSI
jgi:hypothetical protein